jgi:hypothetical protein
MVHVEDASVADGAMMASFGFEYMADETVSSLFNFSVVEMEALAIQKIW